MDSFPSNAVYAVRLEIEGGESLDQATLDVGQTLDSLFGSPDDPKWPDFLQGDLASVVSLDRLKQAAGQIRSDEEDVHFGLYRKHCILCHGTSGDGLGPTAKLLNPYPRDFRLGKFKYKSTPLGSKPTREDLIRLLRHGVPGTSMAAFDLLKEDEVEALVDYVIYLTVRGEAERALLKTAAMDLDYGDGESLTDDTSMVAAVVQRAVSSWALARDRVPVVEFPSDLPVLGSVRGSGYDETPDPGRLAEIEQSVARGREIYQGPIANCSKCHGVTAMGEGQTTDYDDWTKDYTVLAGIDPQSREELRPMLAAGALKPRHIQPRNLRSGIYRGGGGPQDLYLRIVHGIEGTPMPAAPLLRDNPQGLSERDVWDLVNYLLSLPGDALSMDIGGAGSADEGGIDGR